ncbi:MAG: TIGR00304 family membrane protein [Thermoplasmata archaeon]
MKPLTSFLIAAAFFVASEAILAYYGYVKIFVIFFIPVFVSSSIFAFLPLLFFLIPVLFSLRPNEDTYRYYVPGTENLESNVERQKNETKFGGIVMIGPIPIVFGKGISGRVLIILATIMLILIIAWFVLSK